MKSNNYNNTIENKYVDTKTDTNTVRIAIKTFSIAFDTSDFRYGNHEFVVQEEQIIISSEIKLNRYQIDECMRKYKEYFITSFSVKTEDYAPYIGIQIDEHVPRIISDSRMYAHDFNIRENISLMIRDGIIRVGTNRRSWETFYHCYKNNISPIPCVCGPIDNNQYEIVLDDGIIVTIVQDADRGNNEPVERYCYKVDDLIYNVILNAMCQPNGKDNLERLYKFVRLGLNTVQVSDEENIRYYFEQLKSLVEQILGGLGYDIIIR